MVVALCLGNWARLVHRQRYVAQKNNGGEHHALLQRCYNEGYLSDAACLENYDEDNTDTDEEESNTNKKKRKKESTHLIVLVHGWLGNAMEMEALRESLLEQSDLKRRFQTTKLQQKKKLLSSLLPPLHKNERVVIHSAISNEGKTHDGIEAGGKRVANEINNLVQELWNKQEEQSHQSNNNNQIRLSLIGNSLGGLYARYALSEIQWTGFANNNKKKKKKKLLIPHHFITTSTPHLGCGFQQTYLPLPRFIENPIAHVMQQSGKDLFRFTNVIDDMTFQSKFMVPLSKFQQRIAYINVHGTDFQVPTPTAAFWGDTDSIHYVIEEEDDDDHIVNDDLEESGGSSSSSSSSDDDSEITAPAAATDDKQEANNNNNKGWPSGIVMKLATMPQTKRKRNEKEKEEESKLENDDDDDSSTCTTTASAEVLSLKLDQLGWTKVLVDVRNEMPLSFRRSSSSTSLSTSEQQRQEGAVGGGSSSSTADDDNDGKVETKKKEWTSRELLAEFDTGRLQSIPLGHTVLVANSKNDIYRKINKAGIPIMDHLAKELINST